MTKRRYEYLVPGMRISRFLCGTMGSFGGDGIFFMYMSAMDISLRQTIQWKCRLPMKNMEFLHRKCCGCWLWKFVYGIIFDGNIGRSIKYWILCLYKSRGYWPWKSGYDDEIRWG